MKKGNSRTRVVTWRSSLPDHPASIPPSSAACAESYLSLLHLVKRYKLIILLMFHYQLQTQIILGYLITYYFLMWDYYILNKSITISKLNNMYQIRPAVHRQKPKSMKLFMKLRVEWCITITYRMAVIFVTNSRCGPQAARRTRGRSARPLRETREPRTQGPGA